MSTREITVLLSEELAQDAEASGLLRREAIERLLRDEVRKLQVEKLFVAADRLRAAGPNLTPTEIEDEIQAARDARRAASRGA